MSDDDILASIRAMVEKEHELRGHVESHQDPAEAVLRPKRVCRGVHGLTPYPGREGDG